MDRSTDWQPIETAPKDGTRILLFHPDRHEELQIMIGKWHAGHELWENEGVFSCGMTHWKPLPLPPNHLAKKIIRLFSAHSSER